MERLHKNSCNDCNQQCGIMLRTGHDIPDIPSRGYSRTFSFPQTHPNTIDWRVSWRISFSSSCSFHFFFFPFRKTPLLPLPRVCVSYYRLDALSTVSHMYYVYFYIHTYLYTIFFLFFLIIWLQQAKPGICSRAC